MNGPLILQHQSTNTATEEPAQSVQTQRSGTAWHRRCRGTGRQQVSEEHTPKWTKEPTKKKERWFRRPRRTKPGTGTSKDAVARSQHEPRTTSTEGRVRARYPSRRPQSAATGQKGRITQGPVWPSEGRKQGPVTGPQTGPQTGPKRDPKRDPKWLQFGPKWLQFGRRASSSCILSSRLEAWR